MQRLRELLPSDITNGERQKYFVEHLSGIEIDDFAREICWSRLVLADYPHKSVWSLHPGNVFRGDLLATELDKARIVLCNPPFEQFSQEERQSYNQDLLPKKPAELLKRIFQKPPELLGLVLPRLFERGGAYKKFHKQLAETYDDVELFSLPEVFTFSDSLSTLVIASGKRDYPGTVRIKHRRIDSKADRNKFLQSGVEPPEVRSRFEPQDYLDKEFTLLTPPLKKVWEYLADLPKLSSTIKEIHRGVRWKNKEELQKQNSDPVLDHYEEGYLRGAKLAEDNLQQYFVSTGEYLSLRKEDQYNKAYRLNWTQAKVVCGAARVTRSVWRLGAVADDRGLAFSQRFIAIWTKENISHFAFAAFLNSPLANAYAYSHEIGGDVRFKTIKNLPILPGMLDTGSKLDVLSRKIHQYSPAGGSRRHLVEKLLLRIDAEILRQYDLPPYMERELLDLFQSVSRPVAVDFNGYYPDDFTAYFPLQEIISDSFRLAKADRLMENLPMIDNKELAEYLDEFFSENEY